MLEAYFGDLPAWAVVVIVVALILGVTTCTYIESRPEPVECVTRDGVETCTYE